MYYIDDSGNETKIGADGSNVGGVESSEIITRLERLENQQKRVSVENTYKLTEMGYINSLNNISVTSKGSELLKSENSVVEEFDSVDSIDIDYSRNVTVSNGAVVLGDSTNIYTEGVMTTKQIHVEPTDNITLKASDILPHAYGSDIATIGNAQWLAVGKDMNGRIWLFVANHRTYSTNITFYYTIYNSDGTIFKETSTFSSGTTKYALMFGSQVTFDAKGRVFLSCMLRDTQTQWGYDWGYNGTYATGTNASTTTGHGYGNAGLLVYHIFLPDGTYSHSSPYLRMVSSSRGLGLPSIPKLVSSNKGYAVRCNGGTAFLYCNSTTTKEMLGTNYSLYIIDENGGYKDHGTYGSMAGTNNDKNATLHDYVFNHNDDIYFTESEIGAFGASTRVSLRLRKVEMSGNTLVVKAFTTIPTTYAPYRVCGGLNKVHYNKVDKHLYLFSSNGINFTVAKYMITDTGIQYVKHNDITLTRQVYYRTTPFAGGTPKVIDDGNIMHISFLSKGDGNAPSSLHYISVDTECRVVTNDFLVSAYDNKHINDFYMVKSGDNLHFFYGYGTITEEGNCDNAFWNSQPTTIAYQILNVRTGVWHDIINNETIELDSETDSVRLRAFLKSPQYGTTPEIERFVLEYTPVDGKQITSGELETVRVASVSSTGRGVLTADYDLNEGIIEWFLSYDGGVSWRSVDLGSDFTFSYVNAPDFRVKAVIRIPDFTSKSPVIRSFTLRTDSVVLHSDIEEIQINLMKTNFKIDSYTNAVKNDLLKMSIDVFSNTEHIDLVNSNIDYDTTNRTVGGVELVTKADTTSSNMGYILLTSDEILPNTDSYIEYYASKDGGDTFYPIDKDVLTNIPDGSKDTGTLILKAKFNNGAKLNAWAWAWN